MLIKLYVPCTTKLNDCFRPRVLNELQISRDVLRDCHYVREDTYNANPLLYTNFKLDNMKIDCERDEPLLNWYISRKVLTVNLIIFNHLFNIAVINSTIGDLKLYDDTAIDTFRLLKLGLPIRWVCDYDRLIFLKYDSMENGLYIIILTEIKRIHTYPISLLESQVVPKGVLITTDEKINI